MSRPKAQVAALLASPEETEQQFYEALQQADLEHLMALWADEDEAACVHPGGPRVVGLRAVRASFEALFAHGALAIHPERVRRMQTTDCAVHLVLERVQMQSAAEGAPSQTGWVIATNVYVKTAFGWRIVLHHASPGSAQDVQDVVEEATTLH